MRGVDQGLAALLGAGIGVVGVLSTAVLTYASTRHQGRQARAAEHDRSLRAERRSTYLEFWNGVYKEVTEYRQFLHAVDDFFSNRTEIEPNWQAWGEWYELRIQATFELDRLRTGVSLVGPESVSVAAQEVFGGLIDASLSVRDLVERRDPVEWRPHAVKAALVSVERGHGAFISQARSVITSPVQS